MKACLFSICLLIFASTLHAQDSTVVIKEEGANEQLDRVLDVSEMSFRQRIRLGGGFSGLSFGNPTSIGITPMIGYQLSNQAILGFGFSYQYYSLRTFPFNANAPRVTNNLIGQRLFIRQEVPLLNSLIGNGFLIAQVENFQNLSDPNYSYSNPLLLGIGMGPRLGFTLNVMYNLNHNSTKGFSPYASPLVIQAGGFFF